MKNIYVISGSGQVTSETVADQLNIQLTERGVSERAEINVIGMNEIGKQVTADDLVVSTKLLDEQTVSAPVFSGLPFLTGIRISQEVDKIVCSL